ncbi:MAG: hypothetical protein LBK70_01940 [Clostridiales bacterium]|jgi:aldose 1-epimerase|nr:hypothetical protein [Clostridiales bacterium]
MIVVEEYGKLPTGQVASLYTIVNKHGNKLSLTNWGSRIVLLSIKDKIGDYRDVVLGYDNLDGYLQDKHYMGALLGINVGKSVVKRTLHDGIQVFVSDDIDTFKHADTVSLDNVLWDCVVSGQENQESITMQHKMNLPLGTLLISISYSWSEDNQLTIVDRASSTYNCEVNFVQQAFFNLNGQGTIEGHTALVNADYVSSTDGGWTPTEFVPTQGRIDLKKPKSLKNLSSAKHKLIKYSDGLDLCYQLNVGNNVLADSLHYVGRVRAKQSAIKLEIHTTKSHLYFYTANRFDRVPGKRQPIVSYTQPDNNFDNVNSKKDGVYNKHSGFCISPITVDNVVLANKPYVNKTVYKLIVR